MNSSTITKYFHANGLQMATIKGGIISYYHHDHLGSTKIKTGAQLEIDFQANYKPFGIRLGGNGTSVIMYTGKRKDEESDLYYFPARYFESGSQRDASLRSEALS